MKASTLISTQLTCLVIMAGTMAMIFRSIIATTLFIAAFLIIIRCSIYIEKHRKRLLKELKRE